MDRRAIALKALLNHPEVKLIAKVNHVDNFTLWAAPIVWDTIIGTFEHIARGDDAEVEEYNQLCKDATLTIKGRGQYNEKVDYTMICATQSPLATSICHEAYEEIRASW